MSLDAKLTGLYNKKSGLEATATQTFGQITTKTFSKITTTLIGNAFEKKLGLNPKKTLSVLNSSTSSGMITWLKSQNISPEILKDEKKAADWVRKHQSEFNEYIIHVMNG